jgi:hypothetical protein
VGKSATLIGMGHYSQEFTFVITEGMEIGTNGHVRVGTARERSSSDGLHTAMRSGAAGIERVAQPVT